MSQIKFTPMPTEYADACWAGEPDANGLAPERHMSDGSGIPCRHCLQTVAAGDPYLILAYRPFDMLQPYAEVGPIFLHADRCTRYQGDGSTPALYLDGEQRLLKGYNNDDRIIYGTGKIVEPESIADYAGQLLGDPSVSYVHMRSSQNNCYSCRIDRTGD